MCVLEGRCRGGLRASRDAAAEVLLAPAGGRAGASASHPPVQPWVRQRAPCPLPGAGRGPPAQRRECCPRAPRRRGFNPPAATAAGAVAGGACDVLRVTERGRACNAQAVSESDGDGARAHARTSAASPLFAKDFTPVGSKRVLAAGACKLEAQSGAQGAWGGGRGAGARARQHARPPPKQQAQSTRETNQNHWQCNLGGG